MGQTNPQYPVREVALACRDAAPHTGGMKAKALEGDIIAVRSPGPAIGRMESAAFVWLLMDGLEENQWARMTDPLGDTDEEAPPLVVGKRRYCVPFARLAQVWPGFSPVMARDLTQRYQPARVLDVERHDWLGTSQRPLSAHGLIFDRYRQEYL